MRCHVAKGAASAAVTVCQCMPACHNKLSSHSLQLGPRGHVCLRVFCSMHVCARLQAELPPGDVPEAPWHASVVAAKPSIALG